MPAPLGNRLRVASCLLLVAIGSLVPPRIVSGQEPPQPQTGETPNLLDALGPTDLLGGPGGGEHLALSGGFRVVSGGREGTLSLTADSEFGWHVYSITQRDGGPQRSRIDVEPSEQFQVSGPFKPDPPPDVKSYEFFPVPVEEHPGRVTWTAPIRLADGLAPEGLVIRLRFSGQVCADEGACIPISDRKVEARFVGYYEPLPVAKPSPSATEPARSRLDLDKLDAHGAAGRDTPIGVILPMAFAAGLILNFMPCVLPVIGLKVMSFVQQSGDSRRRIFMLNVWYTVGIMAVFLVLATLAALPSVGLGWGEQFSSATFNVVLSSVVFAFALSFLGIWEIPIPGFVGSGEVHSLADREGPTGALAKGVLTTVLATPCSGPLLTPALTWAVSQPPLVTYLGFACVGMGMASPYLVIGAFPRLISFLPRPGAWMETFKQVMGFVLLGTVVFLLSFMSIPYVVPTVAFMIGLWAALWWVGRIPLHEPRLVRFRGWAVAAAFATFVGLVSYTSLFSPWWPGLLPIMESRYQQAVDREWAARYGSNTTTGAAPPRAAGEAELAWQPFSVDLLGNLTENGKTVLVDFTADWCLTCKSNERLALNQPETKRFVEENGIETLKADKTVPSPEIDDFLRRLGNKAGSVPFYAIFPAGNPNQPILLDGLITSPRTFLDALAKAGPSRGKS